MLDNTFELIYIGAVHIYANAEDLSIDRAVKLADKLYAEVEALQEAHDQAITERMQQAHNHSLKEMTP